jgi:hypothetical protein
MGSGNIRIPTDTTDNGGDIKMPNDNPEAATRKSGWTWTALIWSVFGIFVLGSLAYGLYSSGGALLQSLRDTEVARGLITFLVVFTTVAIGLTLVLYPLVGSDKEPLKDRIGFAKETFTALLGILGTILGFYFGSATRSALEEAPRAELSRSSALQVASVFISNENPKKGDTIVLSSFVSGGKPPYTYSISFTPPNVIEQVIDAMSSDGIIKQELKIPESIQEDTEFTFQIVIKDSSGELTTYDDKTKKFLVKAQ